MFSGACPDIFANPNRYRQATNVGTCSRQVGLQGWKIIE
ncbi:hypothetical protein C4K22_0885 [Pseudomonas chlororaphis subsp. aurantiaca]|uniref:Uncharacterized protein n=1 Tax=Pseudomonas chlororaphis subsp. aureofaciens TaxID=587851 RepID=A0AAD0ZBP8_9PSED|nr:hypothetical protein C4K38_0891 [Pseudomonas chlororaphis subsp. piscium]AZD20189.1 hypothetical protein C4K24_0867 [Pseudomonas chlororaphis subsp. aurantiaca]AZD83705.1 hypothetical protein C4K14_0862 [Pseudomonas chlororaphis subsp. aureofaciens]AZC35275.1 hypothetical protein C4K37_0869 [Pseudomonas chlororaphis subsp. piscium]AZC41816.1 hypothetical protein C4K36_0872 [Pseudomonas chlororaphis subsp. piscium]